MIEKDKVLDKLRSMNPNDVSDIVNKSLQEAGIELCDDVNGIVGFSLTDDKDRIKAEF